MYGKVRKRAGSYNVEGVLDSQERGDFIVITPYIDHVPR